MTNTNTTPLLQWTAKSRSDHVRSKRWYVVAGSFCLTLIAYGVLLGSWSMSVVVALLLALYFLVRNEPHRVHTVRIMELGMEIDSKLTPWADLKEFWILQGSDYAELHVEHARKSRRDVVVQTGDADPYQIRDTLLQFLPQADRKERFLDALTRLLRL